MVETTTTTETTGAVQDAPLDPFSDASYAEAPIAPTEAKQETGEEKTDPNTPKKEEVVTTTPATVDVTATLKENLGFESWEEAKKHFEELKTKAETPAEIKFANEQSKKLFDYLKEGKEDDLYSFLDQKKKLSKVDKMKAEEALSLHLQLTNKDYTEDDVRDLMEEKYARPEKPVQKEDELDEEYKTRQDKWKAQCEKIDRRVEREARIAKAELAKLNQELVLPDIAKPAPATDPKAEAAKREEAERLDKAAEVYQQTLASEFSKAKGFDVEYKDEEVAIPLSYQFSDADKNALKERLTNFDPMDYLDKRWFENGKPKVATIMEDLYMLENRQQVLSKIANDAGQKRLAEFRKEKANINVTTPNNPGRFNPGEKTVAELQAEAIWSA